MIPYPVGTIVTYHGSHSRDPSRHWIIRGHAEPRDGLKDYAVNYPDGVAYMIWPVDVMYKFGNRCYSVVQVRRISLKIVDLAEED